ncbi:MAG: cyclodeaminase/cyclohydrolase family protein [Planctomycetes bacterium]|nr:cyclodeaminase/cyclohydrolase family protein [Planctomycetota bacterium]
MLRDQTLKAFADAVAAKTAVPGGGSVSAYASTLGAALGIMAARYSEGSAALETSRRLEGISNELLALVDKDAEAYSVVSSAYGLPKGTEDEKTRRKDAIQRALVDAADVPLQGMRLGVQALEAVEAFADSCNKKLASDLAGVAILLKAGIEGCSWNVRINASGLSDPARRSGLIEECERTWTEAGRRADAILHHASGMMKKI